MLLNYRVSIAFSPITHNFLEKAWLKKRIYLAPEIGTMGRLLYHCHVLDYASEFEMENLLEASGLARLSILGNLLQGLVSKAGPCLYARAAYNVAVSSFLNRELRNLNNLDDRWPILAATALAHAQDKEMTARWIYGRIDRALTLVAHHGNSNVQASEAELREFLELPLAPAAESRTLHKMRYFISFNAARRGLQLHQALFDPCNQLCQGNIIKALDDKMGGESVSKSISAMDPETLRIWRLIVTTFPRLDSEWWHKTLFAEPDGHLRRALDNPSMALLTMMSLKCPMQSAFTRIDDLHKRNLLPAVMISAAHIRFAFKFSKLHLALLEHLEQGHVMNNEALDYIAGI